MKNDRVDGYVFLVHRPILVEADLVLGVKHPHLTPDATRNQNIRLLLSQLDRRPGECIEVFSETNLFLKPFNFFKRIFLLQVFVFVLHENCATDDIDDTNGVATASRDSGGSFRCILGIWLEHNLPNL